MQYLIKKSARQFVVTIEDDAGKVLDTSAPFDKKHVAMDLRDRASAGGVSAFADIGKEPVSEPQPPETEPPAPRRKRGRKPAAPKPEPKPAPRKKRKR